MSGWLDALAAGEPAVIVTVVEAAGSTPRAAGARMVVTGSGLAGTIGGGTLEFEAMARARRLIAEGGRAAVLLDLALGPGLGQCCGGRARLVLEPVRPGEAAWLAAARELDRQGLAHAMAVRLADPAGRWVVGPDAAVVPAAVGKAALALLAAGRQGPAAVLLDEAGVPAKGRRPPAWLIERRLPPPLTLFLFGAGHVGRAVAHVAALLPLRLIWADQRPDAFPAVLPENAETVPTADPARLVRHAPPGTAFLVMTHSHALDYEITAAALARDDALWVGLIGSATKRARFERQMRALGMGEARLRRLVCPIGIPGLQGKSPGEIAVAVAAELLMLLPADAERRPHRPAEAAAEAPAP